MLPSESIREKMTSDTDAADVKMDESVEIALDPTTQASCLSVSEDGNNLVVTCISKGSPAGTVQANRAFSRSIDGPVRLKRPCVEIYYASLLFVYMSFFCVILVTHFLLYDGFRWFSVPPELLSVLVLFHVPSMTNELMRKRRLRISR